MSEFNKFTKAFDDAVGSGNVNAASTAMTAYVRKHSAATGKPLSQSMQLTRAWMGYDMGGNREASTRNTPQGQEAIQRAYQELGLEDGMA